MLTGRKSKLPWGPLEPVFALCSVKVSLCSNFHLAQSKGLFPGLYLQAFMVSSQATALLTSQTPYCSLTPVKVPSAIPVTLHTASSACKGNASHFIPTSLQCVHLQNFVLPAVLPLLGWSRGVICHTQQCARHTENFKYILSG